ncbi:uncharacterized protein LOC112554924 isoform X4 [Pomacea canaliculata]|uniref:uncharacterized protein LOC112554924 isoform X4 n=1 Tax=Pomacea canaliculata TaxID=400727 RepID=UPI000D72D75C|nr:uncharacterized protein LOC112554924 isoform X4 [Pomacea canaliculata]
MSWFLTPHLKKLENEGVFLKKIGSLLKSSKTHEQQHQAVLTSYTPVMTPSETAETSISHPATAQDSDIRHDTATKQVLLCLQSLSEKTEEVLVGITRLDFGQYLSEPCFSVAAAQLPRASSLPPDLPHNWKQGKFDVLLIHRHYGLVVCNVMSFGDITNDLKMSQEDIVKTIRKKLRDAMLQLNKAEAMLSHLVSDVYPGLRITKTIAVPNLTTDQVQQAISHDSQLTERKAQTTDDSSETLGPAQRRALSTMSDKQPSAPQQGKPRKRGGGRESSRGGGRVKVHLHAVTDEQAALLMDTVNARPLEEVKKKTGADVHFDPNPSPVPGMKIVIIRGVPSQIEEVVRLIREMTGSQLPRASSLPPDLPQSWKQGNFDVLLIHRHYGLVVCNVMSFGDMTNDLKMSQEDIVKTIRKKLRDAVSQLNKAEAMLSHLVSDVCPGLRITKTIAVPNLTTDQVQQAISHDSQLTEDLHCCLKTTDPADIAGVCLCCDQLCDPETPCDVSSHVLKKLGEWWKRRVAVSGPDSHMTRHMYKTLVARVLSRGQLITDRYQVYPTNHVTNATYKEPVS